MYINEKELIEEFWNQDETKMLTVRLLADPKAKLKWDDCVQHKNLIGEILTITDRSKLDPKNYWKFRDLCEAKPINLSRRVISKIYHTEKTARTCQKLYFNYNNEKHEINYTIY